MEEKSDVPKGEIEKTANNLVSKESKQIDSTLGNNGSEKSNKSNSTDIIVPPDLQKADKFIVQSSYFIKKRSMGAKASKMIDSLKEKTDEAVEAIKDVAGKRETSTVPHLLTDENPLTLSVIEQDFSTDKKAILEMATVEKKWVERKKRLEVPIRYEQIFVNNEELGKSGLEESLSQIKDAILNIVPIDYSKKDEQNNSKWVPLMGSDAEVEKTIPLYAEQLMISKKIVKVGDIIIRKREVTTREKIDVNIIKEKIFVENPAEKVNNTKKNRMIKDY